MPERTEKEKAKKERRGTGDILCYVIPCLFFFGTIFHYVLHKRIIFSS